MTARNTHPRRRCRDCGRLRRGLRNICASCANHRTTRKSVMSK